MNFYKRILKIQYLFLLFALILASCASNKSLVNGNPTHPGLTDAQHRQFYYYYYEGLRLKENQQYDQALETFRLCLAIDSLDAGAQSEMGILNASIGLTAAALKNLENSVRLAPSNWWYNVQLISIYSNLKNWPRAIKLAVDLQKIYPNKEEVYNMLASLYKETKEYDKAIAADDRLENLNGIDESLSLDKFRLYILSGKPKKGIAEIDKLINKYPTETRYRVLRGDIYMQQKKPELAYEIYKQVLQEDPQNANVYVSLSEYYKTTNQPEKAMESIVTALKNDQLDVDTKMDILGQYVDKMIKDSTRLVETESLFKMLVDRYPLEEQVHGYYALFLQYLKRDAEAISELETMLTINPKNEQTWFRLIQLTSTDKDFNHLLAVSTRAIENIPKNPTWYFYRGIAQFQLADYRGALLTYKTAIPFITTDQTGMKSDFYAQIADVYFKLEQKDSAFINYDEALKYNPKNILVMNNYAYYLSLEKKELNKAERMSAKTVELEPNNSTYLDTYAWVLYQEANYSLAIFYIEKAVDNLPKGDDPGILLEHYGDILWMSGKDDGKNDAKALEMWQKSYDAGNKTEELKEKIEKKGWVRK
ncbi:MAG: tetratricopeptide repeat protein [Paludibacter sp.]|nr:tetratricopeptide repeat protein [Paludibacter sp.]